MKEELEELEKATDALKNFKSRVANEQPTEDLADIVTKTKDSKKLNDFENKTLVLKDGEEDKTIKFDKTTAMDKLSEVVKEEQYNAISEELEQSLKHRQRQKTWGLIMTIIALVFLPILILFITIGHHSNELVSEDTLATLNIGATVSFIVLIIGLILFIKNINIRLELKFSRLGYHIYCILMFTYGFFCASVILLLYGIVDFKDWIISTAMNTNSHQYYATWFYSTDEINEALKRVAIEEQEPFKEKE